MKILIIDDIVENLYVLEALLTGSGYECVLAADGAQALEKIEKTDFGCVISDILMPVMDGFQLCYHVKSDKKLQKIPFIFYTATYTTQKDEDFCLNLGADLFLIKPLDPEILIKQIIDFLADCENGKIIPKSPTIDDDYAYLKTHNLRLTSKLDHKMEELDKTGELFRSIFISTSDAIVSADNEGNISYINQSALNLFEYKEDEIIEKPVSILVPKNKYQEQQEIFTRLKSGSEIKNFETLRKTNTGKLIPVEISLSIMKDQNGQEIGSTAIIRDITDRKIAEMKLRESEAFNQTLLDTSPDLIYIYDIIERKNVYSNQGIMKILGYSIEEVLTIGENLLPDLMHPDDFNTYLKDIIPRYQIAKDGEFIEHEYRMKHKNGNWCWLNSKESIFMRQEDGSPNQIFGLTSDITNRKKAEKELKEHRENLEVLVKKRTKEIEEKNAALERLNKLFIGRELRMVELKKEIERLKGTSTGSV